MNVFFVQLWNIKWLLLRTCRVWRIIKFFIAEFFGHKNGSWKVKIFINTYLSPKTENSNRVVVQLLGILKMVVVCTYTLEVWVLYSTYIWLLALSTFESRRWPHHTSRFLALNEWFFAFATNGDIQFGDKFRAQCTFVARTSIHYTHSKALFMQKLVIGIWVIAQKLLLMFWDFWQNKNLLNSCKKGN